MQRTTPQVDQVPHAKVFADFPQFDAAGWKDMTQQTLAAGLVDPVLPALGAKTQSLEDPGRFRRDRGLPRPKLHWSRNAVVCEPHCTSVPRRSTALVMPWRSHPPTVRRRQSGLKASCRGGRAPEPQPAALLHTGPECRPCRGRSR